MTAPAPTQQAELSVIEHPFVSSDGSSSRLLPSLGGEQTVKKTVLKHAPLKLTLPTDMEGQGLTCAPINSSNVLVMNVNTDSGATAVVGRVSRRYDFNKPSDFTHLPPPRWHADLQSAPDRLADWVLSGRQIPENGNSQLIFVPWQSYNKTDRRRLYSSDDNALTFAVLCSVRQRKQPQSQQQQQPK